MFSKQTLFAVVAASLAASAQAFDLVADVTADDLSPSVQGLGLGTLGRADGSLTIAVFNRVGGGAPWSQAGNTIALSNGGGALTVTPGGTATVPATNPVAVGAGTQGVTMQNGALAFQGGSWMACPNSVLNSQGFASDAVVLTFKKAGQRSLAGCADVTVRQA